MSRFEQEYMGRGPKDVRAHLIDDLGVVQAKITVREFRHGLLAEIGHMSEIVSTAGSELCRFL